MFGRGWGLLLRTMSWGARAFPSSQATWLSDFPARWIPGVLLPRCFKQHREGTSRCAAGECCQASHISARRRYVRKALQTPQSVSTGREGTASDSHRSEQLPPNSFSSREVPGAPVSRQAGEADWEMQMLLLSFYTAEHPSVLPWGCGVSFLKLLSTPFLSSGSEDLASSDSV